MRKQEERKNCCRRRGTERRGTQKKKRRGSEERKTITKIVLLYFIFICLCLCLWGRNLRCKCMGPASSRSLVDGFSLEGAYDALHELTHILNTQHRQKASQKNYAGALRVVFSLQVSSLLWIPPACPFAGHAFVCSFLLTLCVCCVSLHTHTIQHHIPTIYINNYQHTHKT